MNIEFGLDLRVHQSQFFERGRIQRHHEPPVRQSDLPHTAISRPLVRRHKTMAVETERDVLTGRFADVAHEQQREALAILVLGDAHLHHVVVGITSAVIAHAVNL
ncbi:hypothetical protein [Streptomyces sp. NPDC001139]